VNVGQSADGSGVGAAQSVSHYRVHITNTHTHRESAAAMVYNEHAHYVRARTSGARLTLVSVPDWAVATVPAIAHAAHRHMRHTAHTTCSPWVQATAQASAAAVQRVSTIAHTQPYRWHRCWQWTGSWRRCRRRCRRWQLRQHSATPSYVCAPASAQDSAAVLALVSDCIAHTERARTQAHIVPRCRQRRGQWRRCLNTHQ
jgi:hypothetical protein